MWEFVVVLVILSEINVIVGLEIPPFRDSYETMDASHLLSAIAKEGNPDSLLNLWPFQSFRSSKLLVSGVGEEEWEKMRQETLKALFQV
jgi:hypothetical protein